MRMLLLLVAYQVFAVELNPDRIICPVLAALYNAGDLKTDDAGDATYEQIYDALTNGVWCGDDLADFQALGISDYSMEFKDSETHRDRCLPGTMCYISKKIHGVNNDTVRFLNIFRMNGHQAVEHGISTGTRGGATNTPGIIDCGGKYPCEARFKRFWEPCADKNGRFYQEEIVCVICNAKRFGDRGGEFSYNPAQKGREWQMKAAMFGFLSAFGREDPARNDTLYMTTEDVRSMIMGGKFPSGWQKRKWGCLYSGCSTLSNFYEAVNFELPCDDTSWWQSTGCETTVSETCNLYCNAPNSTCISNRCTCGTDSEGYGMCAVNDVCVKRHKKCPYFGGECEFIAADNPDAPY